MPCHRTLLSWDRPLLERAVAHLAREWRDGPLDLADRLIVVPTRQAGRRLREALARQAAGRAAAVLAPRVVTPDQIVEFAVPAGARPAGPIAARLAWAEVLCQVDLDTVRAVFPTEPPRRDFAWGVRLAADLVRLQRALAENGLRFADVPGRAGPAWAEAERWAQLGRLETAVDARLRDAGLAPPEAVQIAAARAPAPPPAGVACIHLVGVSDPLPLAVAVLEKWSQERAVEVLVFGPPAGLDSFDAWGRPRPDVWGAQPLALADFEQRVRVWADPIEQARAVAGLAAAYAGRGELPGVGCVDAAWLPLLADTLAAAGVRSFVPEGEPRGRQALAGLLRVLQAGVDGGGGEEIGDLGRRGEILDWLTAATPGAFAAADFLTGLDELRAQHLPASLAEFRRHAAALDPAHPGLAAALEQMERLLQRLTAGPFPGAWNDALATIFASRELDLARPEDRAFAEAAEQWREIAREVADALPANVSAGDAGALAVQLLAETRHYGEKPPEALELNGWLELLFSDEPHLVVAGLNDGCIPKAVTGHAFLPESLRERLGLKTDAARLAGDAWQLAALAACRADGGRLDLLLGRTSLAGDPLAPSRLLLLCRDDELARRVQFLFREPPVAAGKPAWRRAWTLRPPVVSPPRTMGTTAFRDYLRCPFRFYLKHVLRMAPVEADKQELNPRDFGELLHSVLERLGRLPAWRDCTDADELARGFRAELDRLVAARLGTELTLPLVVQIESARQRLTAVARVQAETRAAGWRIEYAEWRLPADALAVAGLRITGKIDRIERHETTGRWRVLDYKSAETAVAPRRAHLGSVPSTPSLSPVDGAQGMVGGRERRWLDLQLPLYREAVRATVGTDEVAVGYFNLPKAVTETEIALWPDYDADVQTAARRCAEGVAAAVAAGRFWPPAEDVANDEFASLIHRGTAESFDWTGAGLR